MRESVQQMAEMSTVGSYFPIDPASLRFDTVKSFDLYVRVDQDKFLLYLSRDAAFTEEDVQTLAKKKVKLLYICSEDEEGYKQYVEQHLSEIIRDPKIPVDKKSRIVYDTSSSAVEDVFKEPRSENIQRSKDTISTTVSLILSDDTAARRLMQLTSHDYYTYTHSVNVCVFAVCLAKVVFPRFSEEDMQKLGAGFVLHDVGKSSIPLSVLNKSGPLDDAEWDLMRTHPEESARILGDTGHLTEEAAVIARQHHEWIDGTGYPDKLSNGDIHPFAQICAIVDMFDALTTNRSYRRAMKSFDALNLMKDEMYQHFSREYFDKFVPLFAERSRKPA